MLLSLCPFSRGISFELKENMARLLYLIGMMGAGKTTAGRILAERTGWRFIDMDREIERESGRTIPEIFREQGEGAFRKMETALLRRLSTEEGCIVSTGGGAVLAEENRRILAGSGLVVYLRVSAQDVLERTRGDTGRPNLVAEDRRARIESLIEQRQPLYCATAEVSFKSSGGSPGSLVSRILAHPKVKALFSGAAPRHS